MLKTVDTACTAREKTLVTTHCQSSGTSVYSNVVQLCTHSAHRHTVTKDYAHQYSSVPFAVVE
jgi:hypothetical protein